MTNFAILALGGEVGGAVVGGVIGRGLLRRDDWGEVWRDLS